MNGCSRRIDLLLAPSFFILYHVSRSTPIASVSDSIVDRHIAKSLLLLRVRGRGGGGHIRPRKGIELKKKKRFSSFAHKIS